MTNSAAKLIRRGGPCQNKNKDVILEKEQKFRQKGGKFIMPIGSGEIM